MEKNNELFFDSLEIFETEWHSLKRSVKHRPLILNDKNQNEEKYYVSRLNKKNKNLIEEVSYTLKENKNGLKTFVNSNPNDIYKEIEYVLNKYSFRTHVFELLKTNEVNILTSGCSNTFGQEMPNELIWPSLLKNIVEQKNKNINVKLYNLGVPGLDTTRIITNCYTFIEKYGKPDYICMLLPPIQRTLRLDKDNKLFKTKQDPDYFDNVEHFAKIFFEKKSTLSLEFFNNIFTIKNFETFCKINNIKLAWFCWEKISQKIYENLNFNNLISLINFENETVELLTEHKKNNNKYWHFAADNNHLGLIQHISWSNLFFDKIMENNDNIGN